jgi:hypothetical protein
MKFEIDTRHDQPRFVRSVIALILSALDDGSALPNVVPSNLQPAPGEQLPPPAAPAPGQFGGAPVPPAPPVAAAPVPPAAPTFVPPVGPSGPQPAAPTAPVNFAPPAGVELDRDGLPWDTRIHAASKTKIAAGTWKLKKGMSEQAAFVDGVKAELRRTMAIPAAPAAAAPAPAPLPPAAPQPPAPPPAVAPLPPAAPIPPTPPVPPAAPVAAGDPVDFAGFMQWVAGLIHQGRWTHDHTTATLQRHQLPGAVALASRPDLIPQVVRDIKTQLGIV